MQSPTDDSSTASTTTSQVLRFSDGVAPANIFILSIDTLRRDHLTRWGGPGLTPFLDGLIEGGVVLDDHVQCSNWTFASMSCTTLGRAGRDLEWVPQLSSGGRRKMPEAGTLPRWLRDEAGFFTVVNSITDNTNSNVITSNTIQQTTPHNSSAANTGLRNPKATWTG